PYHNFAAVFAIAIIFILLGGITLIPAIFTLPGRKAFWPAVPKVEEQAANTTLKHGFWAKAGKFVTRKPGVTAGVLILLLVAVSINGMMTKISFNQLESFPEDIESRQGFDMLAENFPPGKLAPLDVVVLSKDKIEVDKEFAEDINNLESAMQDQGGVEEISPTIENEMLQDKEDLPRDFLADSNKAVKLQLTLDGNPYTQNSLDTIDNLRDEENNLLSDNGFDTDNYSLHYAGQTAEQLDIRDMNQRDMIVAFSIIVVLISIMLIFQSGSLIMGLIMILTMLVSYTATLGLGWFVSH